MKQIGLPDLQPENIAPCGMNCALCMAFQRANKRCPGCRQEDPNMPQYCKTCIIRSCPTIRDNTSHLCYECDIMPCKRLKQLDARYRKKYEMSMISNLLNIKEDGIDSFLVNQAKKYTCSKCGDLMCVHRSRCLTCDP